MDPRATSWAPWPPGRTSPDARVAEAALAAAEARFRVTVERAAVGIAQVALDGRWLMVNGNLRGMLGYAETELLERSIQDITHADDLAAELAQVRQLAEGELSLCPQEALHPKGRQPSPGRATGSVLGDPTGTPSSIIAVVQDNSRRKQAEAELNESRDRLRLALDAGRMGLWVWNRPQTGWSGTRGSSSCSHRAGAGPTVHDACVGARPSA